ncbi:unnamed protein product [Gongylonema pulchrum]|uniref:riboflavin kinase n=1 Tax=Gongylonema pulchrum TaxID=637853 RepID=A0A183E3Y1_9BILA|nr:unnamed protein product [Gongylonema pulchrum]
MIENNSGCTEVSKRRMSNTRINGVIDGCSSTALYPFYFHGTVVNGFGRGGRQLGCPTANLDDSAISRLPSDFPTGVFYGFANINCGEVYGMVTSIGWNLHFKNERKTIEVHLLHDFEQDFYGAELRAIALGFLRPMSSFNSLDELKAAIGNDIEAARNLLSGPKMVPYKKSDFFFQ